MVSNQADAGACGLSLPLSITNCISLLLHQGASSADPHMLMVSSEVPESPHLELMEQDSKDSSPSSSSEAQLEYNVSTVWVVYGSLTSRCIKTKQLMPEVPIVNMELIDAWSDCKLLMHKRVSFVLRPQSVLFCSVWAHWLVSVFILDCYTHWLRFPTTSSHSDFVG